MSSACHRRRSAGSSYRTDREIATGSPGRTLEVVPTKNTGLAEELLGAAQKKSNRKIPGSRARTEFSAREKIQMVATIKHLYKQTHLANIGKKQAEVRTS